MKNPGEIATRRVDDTQSSPAVARESKLVRELSSSFGRFAHFCQKSYLTSRSISHKPVQTFKIQWQLWIRQIVIHALPVTAALTIIILNIRGFFIGKQLQGSINQDGTKMLLLQITAKLHELLMLASLSDILHSYLSRLLVFGDGAPLGALTVGEEFGNISYLWSEDFLAICRARYSRKAVLIPLVVVCTILGVVVGPSSATAMAPWRDSWVADQTAISININEERLWPLTLSEATLPKSLCLNLSQDCGADSVWTSLSANLFSYWGESSYGSLKGMPEAAAVAGADSMRMMRVRFRGPISMYQPDFTVATVQPASAARIVNGLRMLWFSDNAERCVRRRGGYCDYEDIKWSLDTKQPTVYVACSPMDSMEDLRFPTMNRTGGSVQTSNISVAASSFTNESTIAAGPVRLDNDNFPRVSTGVLVRINSDNRSFFHACSIDAQWSKSEVATTFLGSPYMVDGNAPDFFVPTAQGSTYQGQRVRIESSWAKIVLSSVDPATNLTVLASLYARGGMPHPSEASEKIESIMTVLIAESMARIESEAELHPVNLSASTTLKNLQWNELRTSATVSTKAQTLKFRTVVTGYGYGILNGRDVGIGPLLSVLVLNVYCLITITHFGVKFCQGKEVVDDRKSMTELLVMALRMSPDQALIDSKGRSRASDSTILRENVKVVSDGKHAGIAFVSPREETLRYQTLRQDDRI